MKKKTIYTNNHKRKPDARTQHTYHVEPQLSGRSPSGAPHLAHLPQGSGTIWKVTLPSPTLTVQENKSQGRGGDLFTATWLVGARAGTKTTDLTTALAFPPWVLTAPGRSPSLPVSLLLGPDSCHSTGWTETWTGSRRICTMHVACVHTVSALRRAPTWTPWETQSCSTTTRLSSTGGRAQDSRAPTMATAWNAGSTVSPWLACACGPV